MSSHSKTLLSFIIPTIDDLRVKRAITSITSSTGWSTHDCELIVVVNNCSKHFYTHLRNHFISGKSRDNIKIVYLRKGNIARARNIGIKAASGRYLVHMDSDCKLVSDYVETLKRHLSNQNLLIARGAVKFAPANNLLSKASCELKKIAYFTRQEIAYAPNLIVKKELYKKVGLFDEKLFHGEDTEWSQRLKNFRVVPRFFSDLIIDHIDHKSILKIIMTYFHYGVGRTYRFKRALLKSNLTLRDKYSTYYRLFNEIPNLRSINSFINKIIILFLYLVRDIGVIYGLFKWNMVK